MENKVEELISELAITYFDLQCTRVYFEIFGSQIELLKILSKNSVNGLTTLDIEQYFEQVSKLYYEFYKQGNWTPNKYMLFLIRAKLINFDESNNYRITDFGRDFLKWFQRTGTSESKYF